MYHKPVPFLEPVFYLPSLIWTFFSIYDTTKYVVTEAKERSMRIPDDLKFDERGLIPAVIQDWRSKEVLMVAYMNAESVKRTVGTGLTWFWSRSRQCFWQKGETSGHIQNVKEILYDCDQDTLLIKVEQTGPACHTGAPSCFFRSFSSGQENRP